MAPNSPRAHATLSDPDALLSFFKFELESAVATSCYITEKVKIVERVHLVAHTLGPQRTREDLVPLLSDTLLPVAEDEVLFTFAQSLGRLANFVGSESVADFECLVRPLETLMSCDETIIRTQAVTSLLEILTRCQTLGFGIPFVEKYLSVTIEQAMKAEWVGTRAAICSLIPSVYPTVTSTQIKRELRKNFNTLIHDEALIVRRSAAAELKNVAAVMEAELLADYLAPLLEHCWETKSPHTIRGSAISGFVMAFKRLKALQQPFSDFLNTITMASPSPAPESPAIGGLDQRPDAPASAFATFVASAVLDRSWRIRLAIAECFDQIVEVCPADDAAVVFPLFRNLLLDNEIEVISPVALAVLGRMSQHISPTTIPYVLDYCSALELLAKDPSTAVKSSVALAIGHFAAALGRKHSEQRILPLFVELLGDENFEVRLNIIRHVGDLGQLWDTDSNMFSLSSTVATSIMSEPQWRIRSEFVHQIPILVKQFGSSAFHQHLEQIYFNSFTDVAYEVRQTAIECIQAVVKRMGTDWATNYLVPQLLEKLRPREYQAALTALGRNAGSTKKKSPESTVVAASCDGHASSAPLSAKKFQQLSPRGEDDASPSGAGNRTFSASSSSHVSKLTFLQAIPALLTVLSRADGERVLMPLLIAALKDEVVNVRIAATRIVKKCCTFDSQTASLISSNKTLKQCLSGLVAAEQDVDVVYFANEVLKAIH